MNGPGPARGCPGRQSGQGIVEYGLILSLMAVVAVVILIAFGGTLADILSVIGEAIDSAT